MSSPFRIPEAQARRGHFAMAERLGVNPDYITERGFTVESDGFGNAHVTWTGTALLPMEEALALLFGEENVTIVDDRKDQG